MSILPHPLPLRCASWFAGPGGRRLRAAAQGLALALAGLAPAAAGTSAPPSAAAPASASAFAPASVPTTPHLADTVLALVRQGYDQPDAALRMLQALATPAPGVAAAASTAMGQRWLLLGQGLVLAGANRSTDTWAMATALRTLAAPLAQADAQLLQAVLADTQGQSQQASSAARAALALYRQACPDDSLPSRAAAAGCDHRTTWQALVLLARHDSRQGQLSGARAQALAAAELARAAGDTGHQAWALALAADLSLSLGENDLAQRQFAQAHRLARLQGDAHVRARVAIYDTLMRARSGHLDGARRAAEAGLWQADRARSPRLRAVLLANLSDIDVKAGRPRAALAAVEQALPVVRRHGDQRLERALLANAALARLGLGQRTQARQTLDELLAAFAAAGADADQATVLREFADALAAAGDLKGALELYHRERRLAAELTARNRQAAMAELQTRYERGAQQRRLAQLAQDNRVIDTQLANRQTQQTLWALGALVLALAGVLVALSYRRVREVNRQLASSHARLQVQSQRDPLTGLANRRGLHQRAAAGTGAAGVQGALLLVDIDHFKRINDGRGHASGDAVLVEVARRLAAAVRPEDLVVRWGGEEFLIYAPHLDADATRALAVRVLHAVGAQPVVLRDVAAGLHGGVVGEVSVPEGITVTASVGFACFPLPLAQLALPLDRAINLADMALYTAKNQGRNRAVGIVRVHAADDAALREVEADFDSAWRRGSLVLDVRVGPSGVGADGVGAGDAGAAAARAVPAAHRAVA